MRFERIRRCLVPMIAGFVALLMPAFGGHAEAHGPQGRAGGRVLEGLSLESRLLGREVRYALYLPPDYDASDRRYPVLYLLHGFTDEEAVAMDVERWDRVLGAPFGRGLVGEERLTDQWRENSPLHLAGTIAVEELRRVRWYLDCGDDDFLYRGNAMLHILLREREIPHEYRVRDGGHVWEYWRTGIRDGLRFLGRGFHR